jgi:hypothetical protein
MNDGQVTTISVRYWSRTDSGNALDIASLERDGTAQLKIGSDELLRSGYDRVSVAVTTSNPLSSTLVSFQPGEVQAGNKPLVEQLLYPTLPTRYVAQAWVNDYAITVDDGEFFFDALPALCGMTAKELIDSLGQSGDWDELSRGQARADAHSGPFEKYPDLTELFLLLRCYTGVAALDKDDPTTWSKITPELWDGFRSRVAAIRAPQEKGLKDSPVHIGHGFLLASATSQKAVWSREIRAGIAQEISIAIEQGSTGRDFTPQFLATVTLSAAWTGPVVLSNIGPSGSLVALQRQALTLSEQHLENFAACQTAELDPRAVAPRQRGG